MKKAFEIWIDDDCDLKGLCGSVIVRQHKEDGDTATSITCSIFDEEELKGKYGYYYPAKGNGCWLIKTEDIVIDRDISSDEALMRNGVASSKTIKKYLDLASEPTEIRELDFEEMSVRLYNVLIQAGIYYYEDLTLMSESDVKLIRNLGRKSFEELCDILKKHEIWFSYTNKVMEYVRSFEIGDTVIFDGEYYTVDNISDDDTYSWYTPPIICIEDDVRDKQLCLRKVRDIMSVKRVSRYYDGHN